MTASCARRRRRTCCDADRLACGCRGGAADRASDFISARASAAIITASSARRHTSATRTSTVGSRSSRRSCRVPATTASWRSAPATQRPARRPRRQPRPGTAAPHGRGHPAAAAGSSNSSSPRPGQPRLRRWNHPPLQSGPSPAHDRHNLAGRPLGVHRNQRQRGTQGKPGGLGLTAAGNSACLCRRFASGQGRRSWRSPARDRVRPEARETRPPRTIAAPNIQFGAAINDGIHTTARRRIWRAACLPSNYRPWPELGRPSAQVSRRG